MNSFSRQAESRPAIKCPDMLALNGFQERAIMMTAFVPAFDPSFAAAVDKLPSCVGGQGTNLTAAIRSANNLLRQMPRGLFHRIWLLTDGQDNHETDGLFAEVARSKAQRININTVGFGQSSGFNPERLKAIAEGTHAGRYIPAETAQQLSTAWRPQTAPRKMHRGEATVFCIDLSLSMNESMGGQRKIDIVRSTMLDLIRYKQAMWSGRPRAA